MATTWLEIVDTAVKIGLGAFLSGFSTYMVGKLNHNKSLEKEYLLKHRSILEQVTLDVEEMTHTLLKYWSFISEWARNNEDNIEITDGKNNQISALRSELYDQFKGMTNSEGSLLLIGCNEQQKVLRNYGSKVSEFYSYASRSNEQLESEKLDEWRMILLNERESLYIALNKAYRCKKI